MDGQTRRIYIDMLITEIYESQFSSIGMIVFVPRSLLLWFCVWINAVSQQCQILHDAQVTRVYDDIAIYA